MVKIQRLHFLLSPCFLVQKHDTAPRHCYRHISCWQPNLRLFRCCVLDHWKGLCFGRGKKEQVPVEYVYIYIHTYIIYSCNVQIVSQHLVRLYDLNACIGKYSGTPSAWELTNSANALENSYLDNHVDFCVKWNGRNLNHPVWTN